MADDAAVRMYLGENSDPCCMNAPSENHRLLNIVKSLVKLGPVGVSSMSHCDGLNRLTMNRVTLTATYDNTIHSQM